MQRKTTTESTASALEDCIEELYDMMDSHSFYGFDRSTKSFDQLYDLCQRYVELYDRLEEKK